MKKNTGALPRIMIVDSDPFVRDSLRFFFDIGHVHYLIFKTGEEGLNALKNQDFDVVVCDYFLPDMDGVCFLNQAKQQSASVSRILMATLITDELVCDIQAAGIDRFIEKPLTVAFLDTMIDELTGARQPEQNMGHQYNSL
jgi:DNA-binding response OmpR family regulator